MKWWQIGLVGYRLRIRFDLTERVEGSRSVTDVQIRLFIQLIFSVRCYSRYLRYIKMKTPVIVGLFFFVFVA